jgi:hypothetical protein
MSVQSPTDAALDLTQKANALSAAANNQNTSQLHYAASFAHQSAVSAWTATGATTAQATASQTQSVNHATTAAQLKTAGR